MKHKLRCIQSPNNKMKNPFANLNVLIVGDVMLDRYLTGAIERISPEAPVPVVRYTGETLRLGGAANVALNVAALGARPFLCSVVGKDTYGADFTDLMRAENLSLLGICASDKRQTTVKSRVLAGRQQVLRIDREDIFALKKKEERRLLKKIDKILEQEKIGLIILQDYNKGVLTKKMIKEIIRRAVQKNIPTAADPKKKNFWAYKNVTLFKPNLAEIRAALSFPVLPEIDSLQRAARAVRKKLGNDFTLITLSEQGVFVDDGEGQKKIPARVRAVTDVCGAGDTVISVAGCAIAVGMKAEEAAVLANLAGGQVCEQPGVVPVNLAQLQKEYKEMSALS